MAYYSKPSDKISWHVNFRSSSRHRRSGYGQTGHRIHPDRLSRGQIIFLTIMSLSLISYVIVQMVKLSV